MRIEEIVIGKPNLLEVLNTQMNVEWTQRNHQHVGEFILGDTVYTIRLDEYDVKGKVLVDFGFTTEGSIQAAELNRNASKIIGAVLNGAAPKLNVINPDYVLVSVDKTSGLVDSRKSLYDTIISWLRRKSTFKISYASDWQENARAFFQIVGAEKPTDEEIHLFIDQVKSKR